MRVSVLIKPAGPGLLAVGAGVLVLAGCGDSLDKRPAVWEYIAPAILAPNCATSSCHSRGAAAAGLDFSDPERGYVSLLGLWVWIVDPTGTASNNCKKVDDQVVCQRAFRPMVTPHNPTASRLVHMLRARGADRMPPDRPLPEADIALIEKWIALGAMKDGKPPPPLAAERADGGSPATDGGTDTGADTATTKTADAKD